MLSRGIDGAILYWTGASGSGNSGHTNEVAIKLMKEAERHPGFEFAIQEDKQALARMFRTALRSDGCSGRRPAIRGEDFLCFTCLHEHERPSGSVLLWPGSL